MHSTLKRKEPVFIKTTDTAFILNKYISFPVFPQYKHCGVFIYIQCKEKYHWYNWTTSGKNEIETSVSEYISVWCNNITLVMWESLL